MKKIILIEDRTPRQISFLNSNNIELSSYKNVIDNMIDEDANKILEDIKNNNFSLLSSYDVVICHQSVENNTIVLSNLKNYCKKQQKTLIFFSGGISANYYENSELEYLELNSQTFYSQNLALFLEATQNEDENILMLCYGKHWKQNVVANILEKTNNFISKQTEDDIELSKFAKDIDSSKLSKIDFDFYPMDVEDGWVYLNEIKKFKDSLLEYCKNFDARLSNTKNTSLALLIHNNNLADIALFENRIRFTTNQDIDKYISDYIIKELASKKFETLFIKDNLSSNYLELYGLRVAYHIRLSKELEDKRFIPIVIISDFDELTLNRFTHEANILFTEGIYLCKNTKEDIQKYQSLDLKGVLDYHEFLSQIKVSRPKDISGEHDIANRWAIYRWSQFLNTNGEAITKNREKIEKMLYFKYLKAKHQIQDTQNSTEILTPQNKGKILFIDDEWDKGWSENLKHIFEKNEDILFESFEYDYKDKSNFNLIVQLMHKKLKEQISKSDIIILDLRLLEADHENNDIESYSGIKILQKIHEINGGIQVIMLTATSKSTILEKLYEYKILGYIKKEHPDDTSITTPENINKFVDLVDKGLDKKYLKVVWNIQKIILEQTFFQQTQKTLRNELKANVPLIFEILNSDMPNKIPFSILSLFKCFEIISQLYIDTNMQFYSNQKPIKFYKADLHMCVEKSEQIKDFWYKSEENKLHVIAYEQLKLKDEVVHNEICKLTLCRNNIIHPSKNSYANRCEVITNPSHQNIIDWFSLLFMFIEKMSQKI